VGTDSADQHGPAAQVDLEAGLEEEEAAALGAAHDRDDGRHRDERKDARDGACTQYSVRRARSAWARACASRRRCSCSMNLAGGYSLSSPRAPRHALLLNKGNR